jgi:predicted Zn finger-like uncharacterized protein
MPAGGLRSVFTQCSNCETVFRLSAEALRAAGGQVRCGRCGEVFNALARLAEDSTGFSKGNSTLEQESRADEILESVLDHIENIEKREETHSEEVVGADDFGPGVEVAQLQFIEPIDDELIDENSLEFTLPPGELDRIFIETRSSPLRQLGMDVPAAERSERVEPFDFLARSERPERSSPVELHIVPSAEPPEVAAKPEPDFLLHEPEPEPEPEVEAAELLEPQLTPHPEELALAASSGAVVPLTRVPGLEVAEDIRNELLASYNYDYSDLRRNPPRSRWPAVLWGLAAFALAAALLAQLMVNNREWIATHVPMLLTGYATPPNASLDSYQLRQWGVTGDPAAKGTLRVRASIMNVAGQPQRYPLLRVSLVNRFGSRVGQRDFEPAEYLGKSTTRMLAPGERTDAALDILDPGKDAEGFEIDVCIRRLDKAVICAGDVAPQAK